MVIGLKLGKEKVILAHELVYDYQRKGLSTRGDDIKIDLQHSDLVNVLEILMLSYKLHQMHSQLCYLLMVLSGFFHWLVDWPVQTGKCSETAGRPLFSLFCCPWYGGLFQDAR